MDHAGQALSTSDTNVVPNLKTTGIQATRGNDLRILKTRFKYDLRMFCFTNRVVDAWNSLPNWIVMANSTNTFKRRLDIYWQDERLSTIFLPRDDAMHKRSLCRHAVSVCLSVTFVDHIKTNKHIFKIFFTIG